MGRLSITFRTNVDLIASASKVEFHYQILAPGPYPIVGPGLYAKISSLNKINYLTNLI